MSQHLNLRSLESKYKGLTVLVSYRYLNNNNLNKGKINDKRLNSAEKYN